MAVANPTTIADRRIPTARAPIASVWRRLSEGDQIGLNRLLSEPFAFMDHPSFAKPKIAQTLFSDELAIAGQLQPWCNAAAYQKNRPVSSLPASGTLTSQQECTLFLRLNYARYRISKILDRFAGKRLTARSVREILWWQQRVKATQCQIVQANFPLVLAMAKRTRLGNIDYAELISEGNMALLRCVDKFDCGRGYKFSTYACRAILKSFSRVAMKIGRYRGRFPVEFDPSLERSDYLEKQRVLHEADCVSELQGIIQSNAASLNDVEAKVIRERFALGKIEGPEACGPKTLEQVGRIIGVTKERVRQIQNRALSKLRSKLQDDFLAA